ncbi:MAG: response regulator [bacterium]
MSLARALATAQTILVIEDYRDTRELISTVLRRKGYRVLEAEDGVEGLLKAKGTIPDLIIMDLALPEMDGVETARQIHATPKLSNTPIFVVSAFLTQAVEDDVRAAGCVEMFTKPFEVGELLEKVGATLGNHR